MFFLYKYAFNRAKPSSNPLNRLVTFILEKKIIVIEHKTGCYRFVKKVIFGENAQKSGENGKKIDRY